MITPPKVRQGRPPAYSVEERRRLILAAAEQVFVERGYGEARMEDIAAAAEMSKKTLYQYFPDKEGVFNAMLGSEDMPAYPDIAAHGETTSSLAPLRETLLTVARFILSPRHIGLTRLIIAEAPKAPALAAIFYENYIERFRNTLRQRFAELEKAGVAEAVTAGAMIEPLIGAIIGPFHLKALLRSEAVSEEDLQERVNIALKMIGLDGQAKAEGTPAA